MAQADTSTERLNTTARGDDKWLGLRWSAIKTWPFPSRIYSLLTVLLALLCATTTVSADSSSIGKSQISITKIATVTASVTQDELRMPVLANTSSQGLVCVETQPTTELFTLQVGFATQIADTLQRNLADLSHFEVQLSTDTQAKHHMGCADTSTAGLKITHPALHQNQLRNNDYTGALQLVVVIL